MGVRSSFKRTMSLEMPDFENSKSFGATKLRFGPWLVIHLFFCIAIPPGCMKSLDLFRKIGHFLAFFGEMLSRYAFH